MECRVALWRYGGATKCLNFPKSKLWRARIDPRRPAHPLNHVEVRRLHKAIVDVLQRALECCLNPAPDFRDPNWWLQGLERILRVYGREDKGYRRCSKPVRRIEQGGPLIFVRGASNDPD
jgi:formamidopyrimidine-DNA glycosylase